MVSGIKIKISSCGELTIVLDLRAMAIKTIPITPIVDKPGKRGAKTC